MGVTQDNTRSLTFKIDKSFSSNFDVLQNIKVTNRKSDTGFSDESKLMISMRDGTSRFGNQITGGSGGGSKLFFFTDFLGKRHSIRGYNSIVYRLDNSNEWQSLGINFSGNNFHFNTVKLPLNLDGSNPTEYTTPVDSTGSELVKKSAGDSGGTSNIGKVIFITSNSGDGEIYRGCFGYISGYDSDTEEYIIGNSGIFGTINTSDPEGDLIGLKSGSKYKIFDTLGEFLQVSNGASFDRYFFGKSDGTLEEFISFQGLATYGLRNIKAIGSSQFLTKQIYYNNSYFSFVKGTLFYSSGNVNNPFFHTFTSSITLSGLNGGDILDIFVFKKRLIIAGSNFIYYITNINDATQIELITDSYGMKSGSLVDVGVDAYFISTDRHIYSLSETISGTLIATNVGKQVNNYIKDFFTSIASGFDGRKLYYYGQIDSNTQGIMVVLDVEYKFWSIYTGLRPSYIVSENGVTYMTDNNSDIVRFFDNTTTKDVGGVDIEQKVVLNELYGSSVFKTDIIASIFIWLDNFTQELYLDTFMANPSGNGRKKRITFNIEETDALSENNPMGEGILGEGILGGNGYESEISFPIMKQIQNNGDSANIWKISITGKEGSPFYLNEIMVDMKINENDNYFSVTNTV